jgi:hypothetical protein
VSRSSKPDSGLRSRACTTGLHPAGCTSGQSPRHPRSTYSFFRSAKSGSSCNRGHSTTLATREGLHTGPRHEAPTARKSLRRGSNASTAALERFSSDEPPLTAKPLMACAGARNAAAGLHNVTRQSYQTARGLLGDSAASRVACATADPQVQPSAWARGAASCAQAHAPARARTVPQAAQRAAAPAWSAWDGACPPRLHSRAHATAFANASTHAPLQAQGSKCPRLTQPDNDCPVQVLPHGLVVKRAAGQRCRDDAELRPQTVQDLRLRGHCAAVAKLSGSVLWPLISDAGSWLDACVL